MKIKGWLMGIAALLVTLLSLWVVQNVMEYKSPHGINQARAFYEQPKEKIDVLAVGSSHIHCGLNTGTLWSEYGLAAFDLSAAEQPFWITYYYLEDAYKYQSPEVVILDLFSAARFKEDYHYPWIRESIYGMKFSGTKFDMLEAAVEPEYRKDYFPAFLSYHNRYVDMNKEDLYNIFGNHRQKREFKGFTPGFIIADQSEPFGGWDELEDYSLTPKSEEYLRKIIELTKEHDSKLMLIVVPYNADERDNITYDRIKEIANEENVWFYNFCDDLDEIGIDRAVDFNDHTHLNYWGSVKFSSYMGRILREEFKVNDRRGEAGYDSWDANAEKLLNEAGAH
ncbi:MAG: hypothetical protein K6G69_00660 [Lachnospiraceae bacterium]|nr:hypothetical protein [Lachnospiraceae bacterium]